MPIAGHSNRALLAAPARLHSTHAGAEMTDRSSQIVAAVGKALNLLRFIDSLSQEQLNLLLDRGLMDEETYQEIEDRTDASDFRSLICFVETHVPGATGEEIIETLTIIAAAELAQGDPEPISIAKLLKSAPGIH
jgi:hypothetical protein